MGYHFEWPAGADKPTFKKDGKHIGVRMDGLVPTIVGTTQEDEQVREEFQSLVAEFMDHIGGEFLRSAMQGQQRVGCPAVHSKEPPPQKKKVTFQTGVFRAVPMQAAPKVKAPPKAPAPPPKMAPQPKRDRPRPNPPPALPSEDSGTDTLGMQPLVSDSSDDEEEKGRPSTWTISSSKGLVARLFGKQNELLVSGPSVVPVKAKDAPTVKAAAKTAMKRPRRADLDPEIIGDAEDYQGLFSEEDCTGDEADDDDDDDDEQEDALRTESGESSIKYYTDRLKKLSAADDTSFQHFKDGFQHLSDTQKKEVLKGQEQLVKRQSRVSAKGTRNCRGAVRGTLHEVTHIPADPEGCEFCARAKMQKAAGTPATERITPLAEAPGERSHWGMIGPTEAAVAGETLAPLGRDEYSNYLKGAGMHSTES